MTYRNRSARCRHGMDRSLVACPTCDGHVQTRDLMRQADPEHRKRITNRVKGYNTKAPASYRGRI